MSLLDWLLNNQPEPEESQLDLFDNSQLTKHERADTATIRNGFTIAA
ncbi:hypothetical protein H6F77_10395 [Microcoleus sp. FACHB-831]|nr:hypothetical protein [Microcoleus sp. FACHB-831]MBD1921500.1 hypothetical protein [Microcoleus sp. FACHB-831]